MYISCLRDVHLDIAMTHGTKAARKNAVHTREKRGKGRRKRREIEEDRKGRKREKV